MPATSFRKSAGLIWEKAATRLRRSREDECTCGHSLICYRSAATNRIERGEAAAPGSALAQEGLADAGEHGESRSFHAVGKSVSAGGIGLGRADHRPV